MQLLKVASAAILWELVQPMNPICRAPNRHLPCYLRTRTRRPVSLAKKICLVLKMRFIRGQTIVVTASPVSRIIHDFSCLCTGIHRMMCWRRLRQETALNSLLQQHHGNGTWWHNPGQSGTLLQDNGKNIRVSNFFLSSFVAIDSGIREDSSILHAEPQDLLPIGVLLM